MAKCVGCEKEMNSFVLTERGRCNHCGLEVTEMLDQLNQAVINERYAAGMEAENAERLEARVIALRQALKDLYDAVLQLRDLVSGDSHVSAWVFDYTEPEIQRAHAVMINMKGAENV